EHAGLELGTGTGASRVDHFGRVVEHLAEAMPADIADDRITVALGMLLDRVRDVAHAVAALGLLDAGRQALIGDLDEALRLDRHLADQIHAARVAVPAVDDAGDVDVDDIALAHRLVVGNPMTHDMVDAGAAAVRETAITQRCWDAAAIEHHRADE